MTYGTVSRCGALAGSLASFLVLSVAGSVPALAAPTDPELLATLELPQGDIEYELELGTLHYFDREGAPFVVQMLDGCAVNDRVWLFGAGFSVIPMPLEVIDLRSAERVRMVLPPFEPGAAVEGVLDPEALAVCGDDLEGGLPALSGSATFTAARGSDYIDTVRVLSDGLDDGYRRILRPGYSSDIVSRGSPVFAVDTSDAYDELMLLAEGRTPGGVEGVVFRGDEGMLPGRARLEKALDDVDRSRVRRAFETARNSRVPQGIIEDLGLRDVREVYHVGFDFDSLGADAYLQQAGWVNTRGEPLVPPQPVEERFTVELARVDGETTSLPLAGPLQGSEAEGRLWQHRADRALVQIIDACELSDSYWVVAGAITEEPVELIVTDTETGSAMKRVLWTDREEVARLADTTTLADCR